MDNSAPQSQSAIVNETVRFDFWTDFPRIDLRHLVERKDPSSKRFHRTSC